MALTLANMLNLHLFLAREDGVNQDPTQVPTVVANGTYNNPLMTFMLNDAIQQFISDTGNAPVITEQKTTSTIVAGLDYVLPTNLVDLFRIEYQVTGGQPLLIPVRNFEQFDEETAAGIALSQTGVPRIAREPYGGAVRLWPQPVAANVTALDQITLYFSGLGNVLVNPTDLPGIPSQFHRAPVYYTLITTWLRKESMEQADRYRAMYEKMVSEAKAFVFDTNRAVDFAMEDVEGIEGGTAYTTGFN